MNRAYLLPIAAITLAALSACPSSDGGPAPSPAVTVSASPSAQVTTRPTTPAATATRSTTTPVDRTAPRKATTPARTTEPTGDADPTEPVTGAGYSSCAELRHDYPNGVPRSHPAYSPPFDPDGDGWACETP